MALTATTRLEAVNTIIGVTGETPINSLTGELPLDAEVAQNILDEVNRSIQAKGWDFNTEADLPLVPNQDGEIELSPTIVKIDVDSRRYYNINPKQRGTKLYDTKNRTFVFSSTLYAEAVYILPFTDIPEAARRYITIKAARVFQKRFLGSDLIDSFTRDEEFEAWVDLRDAHLETGDYNILQQSGSILSRRGRS